MIISYGISQNAKHAGKYSSEYYQVKCDTKVTPFIVVLSTAAIMVCLTGAGFPCNKPASSSLPSSFYSTFHKSTDMEIVIQHMIVINIKLRTYVYIHTVECKAFVISSVTMFIMPTHKAQQCNIQQYISLSREHKQFII